MKIIKTFLYVLTLSVFVYSCTDYSNQIYIDESKKAIVPCSGGVLKEVRVETPEADITYEGVGAIYFNKKNSASRITVVLDVDNDYVINLKPNSSYEIWSYSSNGDQAALHLVLKTDSKSNIIHNDGNNCP